MVTKWYTQYYYLQWQLSRSPERAQEPEVVPKTSQIEEGNEEADEDQEEALMVPQVKVAEDGSLIIDEERSVDLQ